VTLSAPSARALGPAWRGGLIATSILALTWLLTARLLGPSDLWDQAQSKTVSYTTDIVANGRWVLPVERGTLPATKPPLYNWIAAPAVAWLGYASEPAHKLPSVLALLACWLVLVKAGARLGPRLLAPDGDLLGWVAGLAFVANYTIFKLGYLARPDMLLTLWLLLGWMAGTALLVDQRSGAAAPPGRRGRLAVGFWACVGLAALTKGPAALALIVFALLGARLVAGRWRASSAFGWWWGLPAALALVGTWLFAVWRVDPEHLRQELWFNEIYGRVTGLGPEGSHEGPWGLLKGLPTMALYYLVRFLPWSVMSIAALVVLWTREGPGRPRRWQGMDAGGAVLQAAGLFIVVVVALFTFSAGKRADYAAATFGPGALLAAWWLLAPSQPGRGAPWLAPVGAAVVLALMTVRNQRQRMAPSPEFGDTIMAFAVAAGDRMAADPHPVGFRWLGETHLQAMLGYSARDDHEAVLAFVDEHVPCWVVAGGDLTGRLAFDVWLRSQRPGLRLTPVVRSGVLPETRGWQVQVTLFLVERADAP
jgi:4-amino-4-deoxy-L-arabinose transferase-like glycosyltransferase